MITLPNGDRWVIDYEEVRGLPRGDFPPATSIDDFVHTLLYKPKFLAWKYSTEHEQWRGADVYSQVLGQIAINVINTEFITVYELPQGQVVVVHNSYDEDDYYHTSSPAHVAFPDRAAYTQAVSFVDEVPPQGHRGGVAETPGIIKALEIAFCYGGIADAHHKAWIIDQMVRALTGDQYEAFVANRKAGDSGPDTYVWDEGITP